MNEGPLMALNSCSCLHCYMLNVRDSSKLCVPPTNICICALHVVQYCIIALHIHLLRAYTSSRIGMQLSRLHWISTQSKPSLLLMPHWPAATPSSSFSVAPRRSLALRVQPLEAFVWLQLHKQ